ncbi:MAG: glycoside hydrolase family 2 TIM barrel-domain containing protein [Rikenellaceae bacterium]
MKIVLCSLLAALVIPLSAVNGQQIFRGEGTQCQGSVAGVDLSSDSVIDFTPALVKAEDGVSIFSHRFDLPQGWPGRSVYLHLESVRQAYDLVVNGKAVASIEDSFSPANFDISSFISEGENDISLTLRRSKLPLLEIGLFPTARSQFSGSYICAQERVGIYDYTVRFEPQAAPNRAELKFDLILENSDFHAHTLVARYELYNPDGVLIERAIREVVLGAGLRDTLSLQQGISGADEYRWSAAKPNLYRVALHLLSDGVVGESLSFKVGYTDFATRESRLYNFDEMVELCVERYVARSDRETAAFELKGLKSIGKNAIMTMYTQPIWFYELCDELGIYVIEQPNINPPAGDNRKQGGTPANNPALKDEYLKRVASSYYRTRNFTSVVAYSLAKSSGNGYNMYKSYQMLKSLEADRPIIYLGAAGEWNSDSLDIK